MDEEITYGALIRHYRQELREAGKADSTISNQISRLKRFMALAGRDDHDPAGAELEDDETFTRIRDQVIEDGAASNQRAMRSTLQAWRKSYRRLVHQAELPERFDEALRVLVDRSNLSIPSIARSIGTHATTLRDWVKGASAPWCSNEKGLRRIAALEDFFGVDRGCLKLKLRSKNLVRKNPHADKNALSAQHYALKDSELPTALKTEIRKLVRYKTTAITGNQKRNEVWRLKPIDSYAGYVSPLAIIGDEVCVSANVTIKTLRRFFGFLVKEEGWNPQDIRLVHASDPGLVEGYIHFLRDRRGYYTKNVLSTLNDFAALIHPEWGYITQSPEMSSHLGLEKTPGQWADFCEERYQQFRRLINQIKRSGQVRVGRKSKDPIEHILDHPEPASWLFTMVDRMEKDFALTKVSNGPSDAAGFARNIALVKLLTMNPLRLNQLATMTYREDNTGNLRRKHDGTWQLVYEPWEFKNERGAAKETYRADIHPWAANTLEDYLLNHRHNIKGAKECDYVFLSRVPRRKVEGPAKHLFTGIGALVVQITRTYLSEVAPKGFGPHAFRHIIATHYLKRHPGNYPLVAQILHDTLDTVMENYGHLQVGDGLDAWAETVHTLLDRGAA